MNTTKAVGEEEDESINESDSDFSVNQSVAVAGSSTSACNESAPAYEVLSPPRNKLLHRWRM